MNLNSLTSKIRRLSQQLSTASGVVVLVLLIATSVFYFICYSNMLFYEQRFQSIRNVMADGSNNDIVKLSCDNKNLNETIDFLFQEKQILEGKINVCQNSLKKTLQTEKEKEILLKANNNASTAVSLDRKLFNYMATHLRNTPYPGAKNYTLYTVARLGMLPLAGIEPLKPEYGPVINNFTSFRYPITISPCQKVKTDYPSVFIAVVSAPDNFEKRNIIRQTWRTHFNLDDHKKMMNIIGFAFILGLADKNVTQIKIEEESKTHKDIIQVEIPDIYYRLAIKVAGLFNWLNRYCAAQIDFLLKVDDDVYVNVRNLAHFVNEQKAQPPINQRLFGSYIGYGRDYIPDREGKHFISYEEWPWTRYPRFFNGPCVVISGNSILSLLAAMQTTPIMTSEDVYYTGICTEKTNITLHFSSKSTSVFSMECPDLSRPCNLRLFVSWLTSSGSLMNQSHVAIEDFYQNKTQCVVSSTRSNGTNTTINPNEPVHFDFDPYFHPSV
ncbi:lactosylceramide 1,3-N-acetyl-beta-D-glucosaminyltransferase-like [Daphnia pulex]|uniref:lactosylceramide 1,3-N-acetyl-beta-D-glucosaminyltransferase-like n=1 Tax=Daphnia pulex TaxID=6669 RepID=UPI001EDFC354|nr:lactosylceramide 1,3-N-acetyl-beta-D-glucosaminyltransferase-like [Daphnia pulex]